MLVGYPQVIYSSDRQSAEVSVQTRVNPKAQESTLKYFFNDTEQSSPNLTVSNPSGIVNIRVELWSNDDKIGTLNLESVDFIWNHPGINLPDNYKGGQKGAIVEMFGWPYKDIA